MKKLLLLTLAIGMIACSTEEQPTTVQPDCNCDKVVEVQHFTIVGNPTAYLWKYTTINECSGIQRQKTFTTYDVNFSIQIGQCK